ncbi:T9SS type A sorting domain-containing protein [Polaribacter cellanae]|uniref:T9SS type A sorting domain-containing protein n=1 Tax=Polaribacter cellanae TaxID=2818493 RepID=A0A975CNM3_9FLAO|nr:T9SS type A sorting domain-containing protein [Polaribacter cellanae]QTE22402.1 T9SS type A sorting domain-containing protein [Polaribacter cellanae]
MKKILLLIILISYNGFAQCVDPVITNFECTPASYTLTGALVSVANPFSSGVNTSANVGQYTDDGTAAFDNLTFDKGAAINLTTNNVLKFKVYSTKKAPLVVKLEGGTTPAKEINLSLDVTNKWIEYTVDFSSENTSNHQKIVFFFNFNKTDGTTTDMYYVDDIRWETSTTSTAPVLTDFESTKPSDGEFFGTPLAGSTNLKLTIVSNHVASGINLSKNIGKYKDDGTNGFDGLVFDYGSPIDLTTNNFLKIKLYTPTSVQILAKLEGGANAVEIYSPFSTDNGPLNSWIEFTFDFSTYSNNSSGGDANTKLVLFLNPAKTNGTTSDIYYLDDIVWSSSATAGINNLALEKEILAFPTITKDHINIKTASNNIQNINVYNVSGQKVIQNKNINKQEYLLDISTLSKGIYFVKVKSNKNVKDIKIIKQ